MSARTEPPPPPTSTGPFHDETLAAAAKDDRRFALEQAVRVTARRHGDVNNDSSTIGFTLNAARRFLEFIGESDTR